MTVADPSAPSLVVLGIAQDAGYPQAGCRRACCAPAWSDPSRRRHAACLGLIDPASRQRWLIDATPDFREQLRMLDEVAPAESVPGLAAILLTHGHAGHYTGLIHLGREGAWSQNRLGLGPASPATSWAPDRGG